MTIKINSRESDERDLRVLRAVSLGGETFTDVARREGMKRNNVASTIHRIRRSDREAAGKDEEIEWAYQRGGAVISGPLLEAYDPPYAAQDKRRGAS